ncbi:hypothetical protein D3C71_1904110 [compost metagenome]
MSGHFCVDDLCVNFCNAEVRSYRRELLNEFTHHSVGPEIRVLRPHDDGIKDKVSKIKSSGS